MPPSSGSPAQRGYFPLKLSRCSVFRPSIPARTKARSWCSWREGGFISLLEQKRAFLAELTGMEGSSEHRFCFQTQNLGAGAHGAQMENSWKLSKGSPNQVPKGQPALQLGVHLWCNRQAYWEPTLRTLRSSHCGGMEVSGTHARRSERLRTLSCPC